MGARNRTAEARRAVRRSEQEAARLAAREAARVHDLDPGNVMADALWEYAPRNGNPLPVAACGYRHTGRCCGCGDGYCCFGV